MANEQELITLLSFKVDDKSAGALRLQAMKLNQHYKQLGAETDKLIAQSNRLGKTLSTAIGQGSNLSAIAEHTKTLSVLNEQFDQTTKRMEALEAQSTLISNAMKKLSEGPKTAFAQSTEAIDKQSASMEQAARSTTHVAQEMSAAEQEVDRLHDAWKAAAAAVSDMRYRLANADQELASGLITQQEHADATAWMRKEIERLSDAEKAVLSAFAQADNAFRKQIATVDTATNAQKQHNAELAAGRREAYQYGRVGMSFRAVGRGVARVAGVQTVEPLYAAGDIIRGVRGVKLLQTELPDMQRNLRKAAEESKWFSKALTSVVATFNLGAGEKGLGALIAPLTKIGPVAIPASLALMAAVTGYKHLKKSLEEANEEIERAVEVNKQYADAISGAASEDVINQIEQNFARIQKAQVRAAGEELRAPLGDWSIFRIAADMIFGLGSDVDLGLSKSRNALDAYTESIDEADGEIKTLTATNKALVEGLRSTETAFEDYMVLAEAFPDAIKQASEDQLQAFMQNYNAFIGAMTSEEVEDAIAKMRGQVALLEAEWDELNRRKEEGTLTDAGALRMDQIRPQIDQFNFYIDQLTAGLASGATDFADFSQKLQKNLDALDDSWKDALEWSDSVTELNAEIAAMAASPGSVEDVTKQIEDLEREIAKEDQLFANLHIAFKTTNMEEEEFLRLADEANKRFDLLNIRLRLFKDILLPAAQALERTQKIEDARGRALDQQARRLERSGDIAVRALTEDDPDSVRQHMRDLEQEIANINTAIDHWSAMLQRGEITADEFAERLGPLSDEWEDLTHELGLTKDILLPAAQANKDYNDQLEREKELRQELIDQMKTDMQRRTDTRARVLTEEDPQNVIDDIRGIQLEILGWHEYLKDLDGQLKRGRITQKLHDEAARQADQSIKALTADMKALKNEVLPAAERTKSFKDLVDEFVAEMELAAEQARVDADRARRSARDQADFERQRAKALAKHYADLADMDTKLSEAIQKELEKAGKTATDEDKKRLDEEAKFNKQMARLSEDHRLRMLDIARDLSEGLTDAVADRDVQAAIKAIRQAKKKTEEEQEQYELEKKRRWEDYEDRLKQMDDEKKERQKDYRDRIAELRKQHAKERQERINDFNQRLRDEDNERAIAARRQQEDWAREDADRARHYSDQEGKQILHYANLKAIAQFGMIGVEKEVSDAWQRIVGGLRTFSPTPTSYVSSGGYNPLTNRTITQYGTGTSRAKLDEWVLLGDTGPEAARFYGDGRWEVLNPRKTQQALGRQGTQIAISMPVSIHDASNPQQIEAIFESRVLPKLTREVSRAVHARGA